MEGGAGGCAKDTGQRQSMRDSRRTPLRASTDWTMLLWGPCRCGACSFRAITWRNWRVSYVTDMARKPKQMD